MYCVDTYTLCVHSIHDIPHELEDNTQVTSEVKGVLHANDVVRPISVLKSTDRHRESNRQNKVR